jgi:hypothetical protein
LSFPKLLGIAAIALLVGGCGGLASPKAVTSGGNPCPPGGGVTPSPSDSYGTQLPPPPPLPDFGGNPSGGELTTLSEAQASVTFQISLPALLAAPTVYLVNGGLDGEYHVVSLVYQTDCGPIDVTEEIAESSDDAFLQHIQSFVGGWQTHVGFPGFAEQVSIHDGVPALATETAGNASAGMEWQEEGVRYGLAAPQISDEQIVNVAQSFTPSPPTGAPTSSP